MNDSQIKAPDEVRQATKENVGRWVLGISTLGVIVVFAIIWALVK